MREEVILLTADHIDVKGANAKGIKIGHTPGVLDDAVADIATMLVLMTMRRVEEGIQLIKSNEVGRMSMSCVPAGSFLVADAPLGPIRNDRPVHRPPKPHDRFPRLRTHLPRDVATFTRLHQQVGPSNSHIRLVPRPTEPGRD